MNMQTFFTKPVQMLHQAATAPEGELTPGQRIFMIHPMAALVGWGMAGAGLALFSGLPLLAPVYLVIGCYFAANAMKDCADERLEGEPRDLKALGTGLAGMPAILGTSIARQASAFFTGRAAKDEAPVTDKMARWFPLPASAALPVLLATGFIKFSVGAGLALPIITSAGSLTVPDEERRALLKPAEKSAAPI